MIRRSDFLPAGGLSNRHLQTILASIALRQHPRLPLRRQTVDLPDGDFVHVDWTDGDGPIVVILHGLEGSSRSRYAGALMAAVQAAGWRAALVHFRGCSGEPNRLQRSYHAGETGDIDFVVRQIRAEHPGVPLAGAGYSLGGNVLLKYLGETGADCPLGSAVAVSVPFDLQEAAATVSRGFSRFYSRMLVGKMRRRLRRQFRGRETPAPLRRLGHLRTFYEFDDQVTAPLHGFADAAAYYRWCSSRRYLAAIRVPTLIIHALDDPFISPAGVPREDELGARVTLEISERGGHVGFLAGPAPWRLHNWLEPRIVRFLAPFLGGREAATHRPRAAAAAAGAPPVG